MLVETLQARLQQHYDLTIPYQVEQFVSHDAKLAKQLSVESADSAQECHACSETIDPRMAEETLFISQSEDTLEFTLYLDKDVLSLASRHTRTGSNGAVHAYDKHSIDSLCTVVEGVSHAVCLLWHAHHHRQLRALDMELQAEVDKYMLLLESCADNQSRDELHRQLFIDVRYTAPAGSTLHERYKKAGDYAAVYCHWLVQKFPGPGDQLSLYQEMARFYRLSGSAKFDHIRRLH